MATARRAQPSPPSSLPAPGAAEHVWVGRFAMVDGDVREQSPWLADRLCVREEEEVRLLVLAEPADERSAEFCPEVAEAVAELFARESLSLTGGLLRAMRTAHANLAEWNRRSLREHRVAVGVTCIAIRDGVATLAQAGHGLAYLYGPDGFRRYSTEDTEAAAPLGSDGPIEPLFHSIPLEGRQLLAATSAAEAQAGPHALGEALARGPERALAELFLRVRGVPEMTAVLVADLDAPESSPPPRVAQREDEAVEGRRTLAPAPQPEAEPAPAPKPRQPRDLPRLRRAARAAPAAAGRAAGPGGLPWRWVAVLGAAAVAVALLAWALLPDLLGEDRQAALDRAIADAGGYLAAAEETEDAAQQRSALESALAEAERARSIDAEDPRVAALEARARSALAVLDAVVEVSDAQQVIEFSGAITAPFTPASLAAGGGWLWLLDEARGRVIRIDPGGSAEPHEVYAAGETYGGTEAGTPLALAWEAESDRLLVLDQRRTLFAIDSGRPSALPLREAGEVASVAALATYGGNLYLLDPEGGEVWRYLPAGDGFDSERSGLLGGIDLDGASALAVDGDLFLLDDGALRRFAQGREGAPLLRGIDRAPESTAGLVEDPVRGLFYVADRGNDRIVVGDREGAFVRQFRHPSFFDLRGLTLAADGSVLYVLTGEGVVAFDPLQ